MTLTFSWQIIQLMGNFFNDQYQLTQITILQTWNIELGGSVVRTGS